MCEVTLKTVVLRAIQFTFFLTQGVEVKVQGVVGVEEGVPLEHHRRPHCLVRAVQAARAAVHHALPLHLHQAPQPMFVPVV